MAIRIILLFGSIWTYSSSLAAAECPGTRPLYMAIGPVKAKFKLEGRETDSFLDKTLGSGEWERVSDETIRIHVPGENKSEPVVISVHRNNETHEYHKMEVYLEWQLEFTDDGNNRRIAKGHKTLASYIVQENSISEVSIPREVFKENAALIVVAHATKKKGVGKEIHVAIKKVSAQRCNNLVYVPDRKTAILLNQGKILKKGE